MAAPSQEDQPPAAAVAADDASASPAAGHDQAATPGPDTTQPIVDLLAGTTLGLGAPVDAPSRLDQPPPPPPAATAVGASVPATARHVPGITSSYRYGVARVMTSPLAKPPSAKPLAAPLDNPLHKFAQPLLAGDHGPGAPYGLDKIAVVLHELASGGIVSSRWPDNSRAALPAAATAAPAPAPARASLPVDITCWIRARENDAERAALRRERRRLIKIPTDYLRAGEESRDRRRRRSTVRRCLGRLFAVHKDRANARNLSAMMARKMTLESLASAAGDGGATVSAAAEDARAPSSSTEHAGMDELIEKMELSFKD